MVEALDCLRLEAETAKPRRWVLGVLKGIQGVPLVGQPEGGDLVRSGGG
mgnify:CR=1 FL=1